jgi:ParB family chromosome partitioning protein
MSDTPAKLPPQIRLIPIEKIHILNTRVRDQKVFFDIATNISKVGLKRPVTVAPRKPGADGKEYDLICGEGRIEAFMACGQAVIPAIVRDVTEEEALIMSLVENMARRSHRSVDLLKAIELLHQQGYDAKQMAEKTGLTPAYLESVLKLLASGEERLLSAVENGTIPMHVATKIVESPGDEQRVLEELYAEKQIRGKKLLRIKNLIGARKRFGKSLDSSKHRGSKGDRPLSVQAVLKIYHKEVDRKRLLTRKAEIVSHHLLFVTEAFRQLLRDDNFKNLLRAEGIKTLPKPLHHLMTENGAFHA